MIAGRFFAQSRPRTCGAAERRLVALSAGVKVGVQHMNDVLNNGVVV